MKHHPLAERAFRQLYPGRPLRKRLLLRYSSRFNDFNANVADRPGRLGAPGTITFSLSRKFEEVGEEIRIGVLQHLLNRLYKTVVDTEEIRLYNAFIKKLADYVETKRVDPFLKERFDLLNQRFFDGYMLTPNLVWGGETLRKLGHYEYATDTISVSTIFRDADGAVRGVALELLDYVLYHEMLHKKHKFSERAGGFTRSHTRAFRDEERKYRMADGTDPEKALSAYLRRRKRMSRFNLFTHPANQ